MMMQQQLPETPNQKNSLFNAMNRFLGAVNNMDQTIMVPSLLRDVPLDDAERDLGSLRSDDDEGDMYSYYQLLKSIRRDIEWGVRCAAADERRQEQPQPQPQPPMRRKNSSASISSSASSLSSEEEEEDEEMDEDLQKQLQFHLAGLHGVLSKLTVQANSLTRRYKQEVGI